ncbi:hypothetical protein [Flavobacterium sp.]|uniref:hypothetical protein n=1 Tax=Flavobacterium sp. TaxID=239 RepID=UPI002B898C02|nr:hypothetical protein [Flavobacterium sp.]HSD06969.1 hypothetical protein [Flavobacterium sp.]
MKNRILLKENEAVSNELIQLENLKFNNGKRLISMLAGIGLNISKVDNWQAIEQEFMKDYPKANLLFNLQANGIESEYKEAEAFYLKNRYVMTFEAVTPEQIEDIKEKCRVYADQANQIEAHDLINTVVDSLNRLDQLDFKMDLGIIYQISRVFYADTRVKPPLKVDQKSLVSTLVNLK